MSQKEKNSKKLFEEFPAISTQQWEEKINIDLKGADYEKKLSWKTLEGFNVKPYYRKEDLESLKYLDTFPDDYPFTRGNKKKNNSWKIRQNIKAADIASANKKALDILMKGVDSLGFYLDTSKKPTLKEIENLLKNIYADSVELNYYCGDYSLELIRIIDQLTKKYNRELDKISGSVDFDPFGQLLIKGKFAVSEEDSINKCIENFKAVKHLSNFRTIGVNGQIFRAAGSSVVEELAFSLACGNDYLTKLTDRGISINEIAPRMKFNFAVGSIYFMEIAKVRAARLLWANIVNAYGPEKVGVTKMYIHATTSNWNKSLYDPYVNLLRTTTESMSSIIGGIDSLQVNGFNSVYEETTEFSERIARNQQILLKEESYFDKIIDPAAGSYYIENLTNSIAEEAWKLFLEIDELGGYIKAVRKGFIQNKIKETSNKKDIAIASGKSGILGTNMFPNTGEFIEKDLDNSVFEETNQAYENAEFETLKPYRGTQAFERLRYKTDYHSRENKRPVVFLLTYGNLAMRRARAMFSTNFFGCAGFEIIDNQGFKSVESGIKAAIENNADIVVICSSDDEYATIAPEIYEGLKGKAIIAVAGYPKLIIENLKEKGINHFIHVKSNVLEDLQKFQAKLGI